MPELPDVEVLRRYLNATALHRKIKTVRVWSRKILGNISAKKLKLKLKGKSFESTDRHGKYLFVELKGGNGSFSISG